MAKTYAAVDLGAESGRVIVGSLTTNSIQLHEIHRFKNGAVRLGDHLFWDVLRLWNEIKQGLYLARQYTGGSLSSIGLDTWGVDFGLLDSHDTLIGNPHQYRDSSTDGMIETAFERLPQPDIYRQTGTQFIQFNSLYQLLALVIAGSPALSIAQTFLNIPDLFNFFLTGCKANEFTISTTTQCYNPQTHDWAFEVLSALDIPHRIFGEVIPSGTVLGKLRPSVASETGLTDTLVIAGAGHDTACAIAAVPASQPDYVYISSGTWSLMGVELDQPLINEEAMQADFTNEGGADGRIRFLKNIAGLWTVQECRRQWAKTGQEFSYSKLTELAGQSPAFGSLILPTDNRFLAPDDMPAAIQSFCQDTGQPVPQDKGAIIRCALESLALEYRLTLNHLERLTGKHYPVIHVIGGGSKNTLLNQLAADATGRIVIAGPAEATAVGNILVQAKASGDIASLAEGRQLVRQSNTYEPQPTPAWDEAYTRYKKLIEQER